MSEFGDWIATLDDAPDVVGALPFVSTMPDGRRHYWSVEPSGHDETDLDRGFQFGKTLMAISKQYHFPELIGLCVADIVRVGHLGQMEIGFLSVVIVSAHSGSYN